MAALLCVVKQITTSLSLLEDNTSRSKAALKPILIEPSGNVSTTAGNSFFYD